MDNIAKFDGKDAFAYAGKRPWHNKGTKIPGLMTVEEALVAGRVDGEITLEPIMLADINMTPVQNFWATVRNGPETNEDGTLKKIPLGVVGKRYTVIQTREAFDFFNNAIHDGVACIETVGALGNGATVFAMAKVPNTFEPVPGDPVECYILLTTTHDGSGSIQATFTPIRVVCYNTLNAAIKGSKNVIKIRHTKNAKNKLETAHKLMCASDKYWERLSECYKSLAMQNMSRLDVIEFIKNMFPGKLKEVIKNGVSKQEEVVSTRTKNNRLKVFELFEGKAKGSNFAPGTKWQALNAVTEYIDYFKTTRASSDRWESSAFGVSSQNMRQKALDLLLA